MKKMYSPMFEPAFSFNRKMLLSILLFMFTGALPSFAQQVVIGNTTGNKNYLYGPYSATTANSNNYSRYAYLYTAAELGIPNGAVITEVAWLKESGSMTGNNTFNVWLQNTTDASYASIVTWASLIGGAGVSQEYTSATRAMTAAGGTYEIVPLSGSFVYTGKNLRILTDWTGSGTLGGTNNFYYTAASGMAVGISGSSATAVASLRSNLGNNRPTIRITYTYTPTSCSGQPYAAYLTTEAMTISRCAGSQFAITAADTNIAGGITYKWQDSSAGGAWADVTTGTGDATLTYTTAALSATKYFRIKTICAGSGQSVTSGVYRAPVVSAGSVSSATGGSRCGPGTISLSATGTSGTLFNWYDASGVYLGTGNPFVTPFINATTTYQVAAYTGDTAHAGIRDKVGTSNQKSSNQGLIFDAYAPFTLQSVAIYPLGTGADTVTINLQNSSGSVLQSKKILVTGTSSGERTVVPLNFSVPAGTGLKLVLGATLPAKLTGLIRESSSVASFPYDLPGVLSITDGSTANNYMFFYDWVVNAGCESSKTPVTATIGGAPAFSITAAQTACSNGIATLGVTSTLADFDSYIWTPVTNLYSDPAATVPYSGGNAGTVYMKSNVQGSVKYAANAANSLTQCSGTDTTSIFVQPGRAEITAPAFLCVSGAATLNLEPSSGYAPGSIQWQQSSTGSSYLDIPGAGGVSYTTPVISSTTYYRARITNSAGGVCLDPAVTETVHNPQLVSVTPGTRCGPGTVTLGAAASAGARLSWYASASGGSRLGTGTSFTTPVIPVTTSYYVAATNTTSVRTGMPDAVNASAQPTGVGLSFLAYMPFTLDSVAIYPVGTGSGTVTINLTNASNGIVDSKTVTVTGTANGTKTWVPLNFSVPAGSGYKLLWASKTGDITGLLRSTSGTAFPYIVPGVLSITGPTSGSGLYYFFYDWAVSTSCEGSRAAVAATVTPAPALVVSPAAPVVCAGDTVTLTVSSANGGYTYSWTPGAVQGDRIIVSPVSPTRYYINAVDNSGGASHGCVAMDSVDVDVKAPPAAVVVAASQTVFCAGDSVMLTGSSGIGYTYQWQRNDTDINGAVYSTYLAKTSGAYRVIVREGTSCKSVSVPVTVTVNPLPDPVITGVGQNLATGAYISYQWFVDGVPVPGATGQQHQAVKAGKYTVLVTDRNGCVGISAEHPVSLGIQSLSGRAVSIYPNPVTRMLHIDAGKPVHVFISSMEGKTVVDLEGGASVIDLQELADGMYLLEVFDADGTLLRLEKLVKQS